MGDELRGIDEDVDFDHEGARELLKRLRAAKLSIEMLRESRTKAGAAALEDWLGPHAVEFQNRLGVADADASEIAAALREAIQQVQELQDAAAEEQERREAAREYVRAKEENDDNESFMNRNFYDRKNGEDFKPPPKPDPPAKQKHLTAPAPSASDRSSV